MTTPSLSNITAAPVREIADASEAWQREQAERLDGAGIGERRNRFRTMTAQDFAHVVRGELRTSPMVQSLPHC